jgi:hypothetical protein
MNDWLELVRALNRTMTANAPGWTDHNDADPGITTLEVMAYLGEALQFHRETVPGGSDAVTRIIRALERYKEGSVQMEAEALVAETWSGTKRPRYFSGRLLTPEDLTAEQEYHLAAHRRHLRRLHGFGIVDGLKVTFGSSGDTFTVEPGTAIDGHGREIQLREPVTVGIADSTSSPARLVVEYAERGVDPVPVSQDADREWSRIEEGCRVVLGDDSCAHGVTIARLIRDQNKWRADDAFVPARPR